MSETEQRLKQKSIVLPEAPTPMGAYVPAMTVGSLVFVSGQLPREGERMVYTGKVDQDLSVDGGYKAARLAALNALAVLKAELKDLDRVRRIVRLTGHVNSSSGFTGQPLVVNGASDLMLEVFGDKGKHTRMALGVPELPGDAAVAIELIAEAE